MSEHPLKLQCLALAREAYMGCFVQHEVLLRCLAALNEDESEEHFFADIESTNMSFKNTVTRRVQNIGEQEP